MSGIQPDVLPGSDALQARSLHEGSGESILVKKPFGLGSNDTTNVSGGTVPLSHDVNMHDAALAYVEQGLAIFPLHNPLPGGACSCGDEQCGKSNGKHPRTKSGLKDATVNELEIRRSWRNAPSSNIGLPCGAVNRLFVLDVDGVEGQRSLQALCDAHGPLPATRRVITGNGFQYYFTHPGVKVRNAAPIDRAFPGLDSRGDGGYVVAPPSLHYTGRRYENDPQAPLAIAAAPSWLVDFVNSRPPKTPGNAASLAANEIIEGSRNATLTSLAGSMRARGMGHVALEAALLAANQQQCAPPLSDGEVLGIARSIANYPAGTSDDVLVTLNDTGNAERFARQWFDHARFVPEMKKWLIWDGTRWRPDAVSTVVEMAKKTAQQIYEEGTHVTDLKLRDRIVSHSKASQQAPRLMAMLELAQSVPSLVLPIARLDAEPWLLGVANGTLNLRTNELMPANREDCISKISPIGFDATAKCPSFLKFIKQVSGGDHDLVAYLKRVVGYMLTGKTTEQCLFYLYGTGANGKSTLLNICKALLGNDLCRQTSAATITSRVSK